MKPTDVLKSEHRVIERMLDCLEKIAIQCERERRFDAGHATDLIDFFRTFVDRCHHTKEEAHLFPAMEAKGFSPDCGPTRVMRLEHEIGRTHVSAMASVIPPAAAGDDMAEDSFVTHARAYVLLLRDHIRKEDTCLFPAADHALSEAEQNALSAGFDKVEREEMGPGVHEKYHRLADTLCETYGINKTAALE